MYNFFLKGDKYEKSYSICRSLGINDDGLL